MKAYRHLLLASLLGGCAAVPATLASREATVILHSKLIPSRLVQTVIKPYGLEDIDHIDVVPMIEVTTTHSFYRPISNITGLATYASDQNILKARQASPSIDLNKPIVLNRLSPNKKYRIFATAYLTNGDPISDNSYYLDLTVGNDDRPTLGTLLLKLYDLPFAGKAHVAIARDGGLEYDRVDLSLVEASDSVEIPMATASLLARQADGSFTYSHLKANTTYRVLASIRSGDETVGNSSVDIPVADNDDLIEATLSIRVPYVASTLAGNGTAGFVNGFSARFNNPSALAFDSAGNLFVADAGNNAIRKVSPSGVVSTIAGNGVAGFADTDSGSTLFSEPSGIAVAADGTVYVGDRQNHAIRKITADGWVSTLAGGIVGFADGTGLEARFGYPSGLALDSDGTLYVADEDNHSIRKVTPEGVVTTISGAGAGSPGFLDGTAALFHSPSSIVIDRGHNLYVMDTANCALRKLVFDAGSQTWNVTTLAGAYPGVAMGLQDATGSSALFYNPYGLAIDSSDNLYVGDTYNHAIRKVTPQGVVSTIAGAFPSAMSGFVNGRAFDSRFSWPKGIAVAPDGGLYVADYNNHSIRELR